jgi:hypothetical protein
LELENPILAVIIIVVVAATVAIFIGFNTFTTKGTGGALSQQTVINASVIYTKPNYTGIANALDAVGCSVNCGSPKIGIQVTSVLFDSNQNQYPQTTYINLQPNNLLSTINTAPQQNYLGQLAVIFSPKTTIYDKYSNSYDNVPTVTSSPQPLTLTDQAGHYLDLGTVQVAFNAVSSMDGTIIIQGNFASYLDDQPRATGQFAGQGTTKSLLLPLAIIGQPAFTFTFANEGANWQNGTTHIFKIEVSNIQATLNVGSNSYTFSLPNTNLAYVLIMQVNTVKKVVLGVDNKAISVFLNDDTLQVKTTGTQVQCGFLGSGGAVYNGGPSGSIQSLGACDKGSYLGSISVLQNGFLLGKISSGQTGTIQNIARNSQIQFITDAGTFAIQTPVTHFDYIETCKGQIYYNAGTDGTTQLVSQTPFAFCSNNFGG